ncbi:hypothetical protein Mal64_32940 [Pseudobythopirellula maris]|uniref:Restriction endonuclease type IV Mrr domain-containing protein n=1 Tax=Pseudobythopirellula maris TaxID=2527991 RepID=A0A5C5ZGB8_9BACT|nr:hypothetical protein [Pseudobythopirellula maris]TWT86469.1 hypothetical protein Mal64_32940 [Pseudobythopirellula maris]
MWDPENNSWFSEYVELPVVPSGKLLLVPKSIVRRKLDYDADEYYQHYILEHLREIELSANSELVKTLKNGSKRVTKKSLKEKYGTGKRINLQETKNDPAILTRYRNAKRDRVRPPLDHERFALESGTDDPDWDQLLTDVVSLPAGRDNANNYERAIESLLAALMYPALANPEPQTHIHDGRKRIDITYTNVATLGFFLWLAQNYSAPYIYVECKNYSGDPANPELDQLGGRFSPQRGQFGILVCRQIENKELFAERCRDTAQDQRGYIIYLDDDDISSMVDARKNEPGSYMGFDLLQARFDALVR